MNDSNAHEVTAGFSRWLGEHWDPTRPLGEWWRLLADSRWAVPTWPRAWGGAGLSPADAAQVAQAARLPADSWRPRRRRCDAGGADPPRPRNLDGARAKSSC